MNLEQILKDHKLWLQSNGQEGIRADLTDADLTDADLTDSDLTDAVLIRADLRGADLTDADLSGAVLTDADLRGAVLRGAVLWNCTGNRSEIKTIFCSEDYPITYTSTHLQIGCQRHPINDWWGFNNRQIADMDGKKALKFWNEWKEMLQMIIEKSPAKETGHEH